MIENLKAEVERLTKALEGLLTRDYEGDPDVPGGQRFFTRLAHPTEYETMAAIEAALSYNDAPAPPVRCSICHAPEGGHPRRIVGDETVHVCCDGSVTGDSA